MATHYFYEALGREAREAYGKAREAYGKAKAYARRKKERRKSRKTDVEQERGVVPLSQHQSVEATSVTASR